MKQLPILLSILVAFSLANFISGLIKDWLSRTDSQKVRIKLPSGAVSQLEIPRSAGRIQLDSLIRQEVERASLEEGAQRAQVD